MRKSRLLYPMFAVLLAVGLVQGVAQADTSTDESRFVELINVSRSQAGLAPLTADGFLADIARRHSAEMASAGTIFHNSNLASDVTTNWQTLGENVGMGGSVDDLHSAFMNSPSHRDNILGTYQRVGIGIVMSGETMFVTEVFESLAGAPTPVVLGKKICRRVKSRTVCRTVRRRRR